MGIINSFVQFGTNLVSSGGVIFGFLLILLESIIPLLPLGVFITLNINSFGFISGFIISWIGTCVGCFISYFLFKYFSSNILYKFLSLKNRKKINNISKVFCDISFSNLVLIISLPFTPAFLVNIVCGITSMSKRKFVLSLLIGKFFMVFFWAFVGKSFIDSVRDIKSIFIIAIMLIVAYLISKIVSKSTNLD